MRKWKESRFLEDWITRRRLFSVSELGKTEGGWLGRAANIGTQFWACVLEMPIKQLKEMLSRLLIDIWVWIGGRHYASWPSLVAQLVKNLPVMQETWVQSLGQEDPLENIMATHSSILAWRIPWTEEPGRLQSMGLQRVGHDWATFTHFTSNLI